MDRYQHARYVVFAGFCCLIISVGLGRFAYTPILPLLQADTGLTDDWAAYLAIANYVGYFVGTLSLLVCRRCQPPLLFTLGVLVISLLAMGLTEQWWLWLFWRFVAGLAGAWLFMFATTQVLAWLLCINRLHWAGYMYGGVGAGIALAGLAIPWLEHLGGWQAGWFGVAGIALLLTLPAWGISPSAPTITEDHPSVLTAPPDAGQQVLWLWLAYFFEGMGYIISGTFLVVAVTRLPEFTGDAVLVWVIVGLASVPSCVIWAWIGKYSGLLSALLMAYALQTLGIALPVLVGGSVGAYLGALLFGGTFMGVVSMTMGYGKVLMPHRAKQVLTALTLGFAVGQVLGPWFVTGLNSLEEALLLAALFSLLGGLCLFISLLLQQRKLAFSST